MKIRDGFVSNSSSSSFIVAFDKTPETVAEMQNILFKNGGYYHNPYKDDVWTTEQIASIVFVRMPRS